MEKYDSGINKSWLRCQKRCHRSNIKPYFHISICFSLDGQPPKYNTRNQRNTQENTDDKPHPGTSTKSPSPPVRRSSTVKSDSTESSKSAINPNLKENETHESGEGLGGIMYCEDYAEIVENEEGDYSRYHFNFNKLRYS